MRSSLSFLFHRSRLPFLRPLHRSLHGQIPPNPNPNPNPNFSSEDDTTNEFLSRFVHSIRPILASSYPSLPRGALDSMLLLICRRVVSELNPSAGPTTTDVVDLSDDLRSAISAASRSVRDSMRRVRTRAELRNYLHSDDVKEMCRFAGDVGVRGDPMRELRFKWAREKMEEVEFCRELEKIREDASGTVTNVEALPERKGKVGYRIYGLDMSEEKWREVAERAEEAELVEEAKPVVGRVKRIEEKVCGLNWEKDDLMAGLKEWAEALGARRVDWVVFLERMKERNEKLYLKV